jgi:hypothetical protein
MSSTGNSGDGTTAKPRIVDISTAQPRAREVPVHVESLAGEGCARIPPGLRIVHLDKAVRILIRPFGDQ